MIQARKSLGQNFLRDANIARKIVASLDPKPGETVLEIGPGTGALTVPLADSGARIIAVEVDPRAVKHLNELSSTRQWSNVMIRHEDILKTDIDDFVQKGERIRVIGNLPFNITSPVLFRLFENHALVQDAVLMMQREVADRLVCGPGSKEYGILSVMMRYHGQARALFPVAPGVFLPKPNVWSKVVRLVFDVMPQRPAHSFTVFRRVVRGTFGVRRKTVANGLKIAGLNPFPLMERYPELLARRPEQLSLPEFLLLSNALADAGQQDD